jgi:hypothetical protein
MPNQPGAMPLGGSPGGINPTGNNPNPSLGGVPTNP